MGESINQFPEQAARDNIDKQLRAAGWTVQDKENIDWNESIGIAIRGYQTDVGPTDHVLFVERKPVGIIEKSFKDNKPRSLVQMATGAGKTYTAITSNYRLLKFANDIIQIVREEFNEGNEFCNKITYKTKDEDPKYILTRFRNAYIPRIAVTVAMISVGIDVKPLECLLFMRDVKSKGYFEQMKGRGTRTFGYDDLKKVTPSAISAKTHFVVVDAVGVTKSFKTDSRPLERKRSTSMKELLEAVTMGKRNEDLFISLAGRLARLEKQLTDQEKEIFVEKAKGKTLSEAVKDLLNAYNPDKIEEKSEEIKKEKPEITNIQALETAKENLSKTASSIFNGELNGYIENVRRVTGMDDKLTAYDKTVDRNFQKWVFEKQAGALKFNEEQMNWLRMMKEHIATSFHIDVDDLDYTPFDAHGGRGMMFQLFGSGMNAVISEMNEALAV